MIKLLVVLILLHGPDGNQIAINPETVTTVRTARADDRPDKQSTKGIACIITLTDGKFAGVVEDCATVRELLAK
ncbi:hypothetical protein JQ582_26010 [Bradyrhizobium japonicum]|uniref:hypothetical protein n=1 Tax=Bradyrhizobium japonicum TaxID=375 RepID=UPI001BA81ABB|nr:hypothetical protein [Bradyrhizobium japonicum]MBR0747395.1 hypothetical protein [Bradyrhizobium japonicum]